MTLACPPAVAILIPATAWVALFSTTEIVFAVIENLLETELIKIPTASLAVPLFTTPINVSLDISIAPDPMALTSSIPLIVVDK